MGVKQEREEIGGSRICDRMYARSIAHRDLFGTMEWFALEDYF